MSYDVVVIGAGPGGYVSAIRAAQCGLKTAIIDKRQNLGGTCLNVGCIPSKALLQASHFYHHVTHKAAQFGVDIDSARINLPKMMEHKKKTVDANVSGVSYLMKKNKIDVFTGTASFVDSHNIAIKAQDGSEQKISAKNIIIATGSQSAGIRGVDIAFDEKQIITSTGALSLEKVPETMVVIGAGVIGSELGCVWQRLGAKVTVIEYMDKVLGAMDREISSAFQKTMEKQGIVYHLNSQVTAVKKEGASVTVEFSDKAGANSQSVTAQVVLVATGRQAYTQDLGIEKIGINIDKAGRIAINEHWQTCHSHIYAIGDVVRGPMLAHKAEEEGVAVAESIAGMRGHVNYQVIPSVVYTHPEIASVGASEEELKAQNIPYNVGKFPFMANGRARAMAEIDGFVKILAEKDTDTVLGGHIFGVGAGEMIHEIALLMEFSGSSEDLARSCHAHPTLSEAVREAALACFAKPFHI